ncbi:MAG: hypothetical protein ACI4UH_06495 [Dorea sp.]
MKSVIERLAEIEATAEAIVEHAEAQKFEVEKEIQAKRDEFDHQMEAETQAKIGKIREEGEAKMNEILERERNKNRATIDHLKEEFAKNHTVYAQEILKNVLEV